MDTKTTTIKHELDRRFSLTYNETKNKDGNIVLTVNYPKVYDYMAFVEATPLIQDLIFEENKRWYHFMVDLDKQKLSDEMVGLQMSNFDHFHLWTQYEYLIGFVYDPIENLNHEEDKTKLDTWGLAFSKTPYQILKLRIPFKKKIEVIKNRIERGSYRFQFSIKSAVSEFHHRLMNLLAEYEVSPNIITTKEPNEAVKQLGLTPDSKWEEIEIAFRSAYEVRIKYKGKEYIANHEEMGFADKRKPDETKPKLSWELLNLLALGNGVFPLTRLSSTDKAKRKKQKQSLTQHLKDYFQITDDPFYEIDKENMEYKIKIKLLPDPEFRDDWKDRNIYDTTKIPREFLRPV